MKHILLVAIGGALGALARFGVVQIVGTTALIPLATFGVNLVGCFGAGYLIGSFANYEWFEDIGRYLLLIGFLGAFTTFSAFSVDTLNLLEQGQVIRVCLYIGLTTVCCLLVAWIGLKVA